MIVANALAQLVTQVHDVAPRMIQEPVITWNLFLTAFLVPTCSALTAGILMAYINWKMKKQAKKDADIAAAKLRADAEIAERKYKQDEEIAKLRLELETEKAAATMEWRKAQADTLCRVKERVDGIYNVLDSKVDKDDCDRLMGNRINV